MSLEQTLDAIKREGRMEGRMEGREEGKLVGRSEGKEEVAKRLIAMGLDTAAIAEATGFSPDEIEQWRKQVH
jgi:predicted transposase/invertase (TIGR01784 family)